VGGATVVRTDSEGNTRWERLFPVTGADPSVLETSDEEILTLGDMLRLLDRFGDTIWTVNIAADPIFAPRAIAAIETRDGGVAITGCSSVGTGQAYLMKLDSRGRPLWKRSAGVFLREVVGRSVTETRDGDLIVAGVSVSSLQSRLFLVKFDAAGGMQGGNEYGELGLSGEIRSVRETLDGGIVVTGRTEPPGVYLAKHDACGEPIWERQLVGSGGLALAELSDGTLLIAACDQVIRTDSEGIPMAETVWRAGRFGSLLCVSSLQPTFDGGLILVGKGQDQLTEPRDVTFLTKLRSTVARGPLFLRADSDANSLVNLNDAVFTLRYLFQRGTSPICLDSADVNDDGRINLVDVVATLIFVVGRGSHPVAPGAIFCGPDPSEDALPCAAFGPCP